MDMDIYMHEVPVPLSSSRNFSLRSDVLSLKRENDVFSSAKLHVIHKVISMQK